MSDSRWYFTEEQLQSSPSRECGVSADRELAYRQQAANLIQEVGQRLQVYVLIPFCVEARENREIRGPRNASKCPLLAFRVNLVDSKVSGGVNQLLAVFSK
jgi:hypothetical protein